MKACCICYQVRIRGWKAKTSNKIENIRLSPILNNTVLVCFLMARDGEGMWGEVCFRGKNCSYSNLFNLFCNLKSKNTYLHKLKDIHSKEYFQKKKITCSNN